MMDKTEQFKKKYLADSPIQKGYGLYRMVAESAGINHREFAKQIRSMDYNKVLQTLYWRLISLQVKHDAGCRCERCGHGGNLVVHHTTYRYLGYDMYHLSDLHCLCRNCHEEIHGISRTRAYARGNTK